MSEHGMAGGSPELIVVTKPAARISATAKGLASASRAPVADIQNILSEAGASMAPLFEGGGTAAMEAGPADEAGGGADDMSRYFRVDAPEDQLEALAARLREAASVDGAYVKPAGEPPVLVMERQTALNRMTPATGLPPSTTPDFSDRQDYLDPAPVGIDAAYAWGLGGGRGAGIRVIDCEWGWQFDHEDLAQNMFGLVGGSNASSTDHGTAVFGEIGGDRNGFGVTGISADAQLGASSFVGQSSATAIMTAANALSAGDIILLEIHRQGPNGGGGGQQGYIAIEWWPDDFAAIRYAVNKGIIVVEAAGNGWEDLDAAVYDTPGAGFPSSWSNPFRLTNPQSGAVVVGAGDPPSGTHGRVTSPWNQPYVDRARCGFSNWGSRIDAQGWGWEVTSTGYGNLQGGGDARRWYTDTFSGTSSASPIVVGALACTQGILKARNMPLMTSARAAQLLRATGSPQQSAPDRPASQRIGNRPDLRQLVPAALKNWISAQISYTYATYTAQSAWAYVKDYGWRRIQTGSPDGVTNAFELCCQAQATGETARLYMDDQYIYTVWLS